MRSIIARYTTHFPLTLFRFKTGKSVSLRDYESQKSKGSRSYDLVLKDGLYQPSPTDSNVFIGPNGASLRPNTMNLHELLDTFSKSKNARIIVIPQDTKIPSHFVLLHEHTDHYSLQTTTPITLKEFNQLLEDFLSQFQTLTISEFADLYPMSEAFSTKTE